MKKLAFLTLLAIAALISSCGSNQIAGLPTSSISGNWEAQLTGGTQGAAALNFLVNFNLFVTNGSGNQGLNINDFSFINSPNSCFPGPPGVTGTVNLTNSLNTNQITGSITLTIKSGTDNTLTLSADPSASPPTGELIGTSSNGVVTNGAVNGQWTLTGSNGCTAGGTSAVVQPSFIMCQNATSCTTATGPSISPSHF
jgi:hypothetical protein